MNKRIIVLLFAAFVTTTSPAQKKTNNIIIITLDGMRWQEVFSGVDSVIVNNKTFTKDSAGIMEKFWSDDPVQRRKKLFPFLWSAVVKQGQIYGNRKYDNYANVMNRYKFSYPGYNEIFTGYPDTAVNSNDKIPNVNSNVLEFINNQKGYKGKVAAFTTWDVFPFILNAKRSGIYVNSDVDTLKFNTPAFRLINDIQFLTAKPVDVRPDVLTYIAAREYLKIYKPKVLYIAFDETDDFAHGGMYDQYLKSAYAQDAMIADLWKTIQSMPEYRNNTTLIITCDHGRGDKIKEEWTSHGTKIEGADEIWMAFLGKGIEAKGEIKEKGQLYQAQLAQTIAELLGMKFKANHPIQKSISFISD
jgi:phosphopentomutase/2,3-bisphosphoglycerate-independent phosphoglycerate mutase family metalloenzyme